MKCSCVLFLFFFFKQKTAYEMRISDWSSDVCSSDLQADGSYKLNGTKIFISSGEHDMAENIVHIVLARLPDAPAGTKGISLFIVPKFLPNAEGEKGERNGVNCGSFEHKMGIHGYAI